MERQGRRRKWDSRRAKQPWRGVTRWGMADWRKVGRKEKEGWGVNIRSEWRINPPPPADTHNLDYGCTPERATLKQTNNDNQWSPCSLQWLLFGSQEFQAVISKSSTDSEDVFLNILTSSMWNSSILFGRWKNVGTKPWVWWQAWLDFHSVAVFRETKTRFWGVVWCCCVPRDWWLKL